MEDVIGQTHTEGSKGRNHVLKQISVRGKIAGLHIQVSQDILDSGVGLVRNAQGKFVDSPTREMSTSNSRQNKDNREIIDKHQMEDSRDNVVTESRIDIEITHKY